VRRREFIIFAGTVALGWPLAVRAQHPGKVYRIGLLGGSPPTASEASARLWDGFFQGLRELGYVEGQNIVVEGRWYGEQTERLPALAAELVRLEVDVIVAGAAPAPEAAQRATSTIPIVMASHRDPVGSGLVASLARPGKNITGLSNLAAELVGKQLQLLKEVVPSISQVAVLWNPTVATQTLALHELESAARSLGVQLQVLEARASSDFVSVFSTMTRDRAGAFITLNSSMFFAERSQLAELAAQSRLPSMYTLKEYAQAGGLITYGPDIRESWRRAASYVDKILKGAKPADLPVEQPTKFELVINLKTARAIGLDIAPTMLARADEVIE
jgi:putative tryptophan/tyrosine transport system substrate-binding protein